ncbi:hypothetical protein ACLOJK_019339 [Asimina triloba]
MENMTRETLTAVGVENVATGEDRGKRRWSSKMEKTTGETLMTFEVRNGVTGEDVIERERQGKTATELGNGEDDGGDADGSRGEVDECGVRPAKEMSRREWSSWVRERQARADENGAPRRESVGRKSDREALVSLPDLIHPRCGFPMTGDVTERRIHQSAVIRRGGGGKWEGPQ